MVNFKQKLHDSPGQAIVEFALVLVALLAMIFLIIESGRILWAWNSVQHAAREGARYAVTGQFYGPNCPIDFGADKYLQPVPPPPPGEESIPGSNNLCHNAQGDTLRTASIVKVTHDALSGLPLNEVSNSFEDDNYYFIQVYGVDTNDAADPAQGGQLKEAFGGQPNTPVVVRVTYQVPIITPFFRPIRATIPVFGQEVLINENFGQQTTDAQGMALPPQVPIIPTAGVTPSPTPSPTPSHTPTPGPTSTPTFTPTPIPCNVQFEGHAIANTNYVYVTGDIGTTVTIIDLTTGHTLGSNVLVDRGGHACPGFADFSSPALTELLIAGHVLLAESSDTTVDTTIVLPEPPSPTPSMTFTPTTIPTSTNTSTPVATSTPSNPYITLIPSCAQGPTVQITVLGFNWDNNESITFTWSGNDGTFYVLPTGHGGSFSFTRAFTDPNGTYTMRAESSGNGANKDISTASFRIPCLDADIPTATPTPTSTPQPADLIIGQPQLISTPPIVAHEPLDFSVRITNVGDVDVNQQFFVDIYLDPANVYTDRIPLSDSSGYIAVSSLGGNQSRDLTIHTQLGFKNTPDPHSVYGMVDSVQQVVEESETNNVSTDLLVGSVTPVAVPPTATPTPNGTQQIAGVVRILTSELFPQYRAIVQLIDPNLGVIAYTQTDANGFYSFNNILPLTDPDRYTVTACIPVDTGTYFGSRTGVQSPYPFANIYMLSGPCS